MVGGDRLLENGVGRIEEAQVLLFGPVGLGGVADGGGDVAVGGEAEQRLEVVDGPESLGVDVVRRLHRAARARPVGGDGVRARLDAGLLCRTGGPAGGEVLLDELDVARLQEIDRPWHGIGPEPVDVLGL